MKMSKEKLICYLCICILVLIQAHDCSKIFGCGPINTCRSAHTGVSMSGGCICQGDFFCDGTLYKNYEYSCVGDCSASGGGCKPNGTRNGVTGYRYSCQGGSCWDDPDCAGKINTPGTTMTGPVLKCSCQ